MAHFPHKVIILLMTATLHGQVNITYLANEGVLISNGTSKVVVDALFRDSLGSYLRHPPDTQERLETGKPPFDKVALALATHYHLDHWDAGAITRFLSHNPAAIFASTPTGTAMLPRGQQPRVRAPFPGTITHAGLTIDVIPLQHGQTQNAAFLATQGNRKWIHLGDADPSPANFEALRKHQPPDIALVAFWWLTNENGRNFLFETWKPGHIIAIHFGASDVAALRNPDPAVWYCTKPGETREF